MPRVLPPNTLTSRAAFFAREAGSWERFVGMWNGIPDTALLMPGACGEVWSVKDVLNHVAAWQEAAVRVIHDLRAGRFGRLGMSGERFNQTMYVANQARPLAESRERLMRARQALLDLLQTIPENQLLGEYGRQQIGWWAKWCTYGHYEQHLDDLDRFRRQSQSADGAGGP